MALLNEEFDQLSLFYENGSTVIFKGIRKSDAVRTILKSHKSPDELFRIKHEYDLLSGKNIVGATNVLDISYNDDKNYLVLEDSGALVLDDYITSHSPDTATFLKIARNAAEALSTIHEQGIVHCDIKPANILIHPDTLQVWYIDFGISFSIHQRESRTEGFAGTLDFMAPEQTGRLNMTVDYRSDLYSLGITLYTMLTGNLPFSGESAVELIHAQTVLPPTPISEYVSVDPTINAIIMKLMEKSPKKRYQSAASLAHDLGQCHRLLGENGSIEPFTLGEKDMFAGLEPGQKLFGKEALLEEMKAAFHNTPKKESSLILLHGPADAGKSTLLQYFEEYVRENNGYLLRGAFDWKESPEPYPAIREAFDGFELYAYNANLPLPEYRKRLLEALGENAQVLIDIIPSFEAILGKQPPVLKLNPLETQARARQVFQKTFQILCDTPYPFVFVIENLHWADENSIGLLLAAAEGRQVGNCVMVLSYRDDDPAFLRRFGPRIHTLDRKKLQVSDIAVPHLGKEELITLFDDFFEVDSLETRELVDIVYRATGGVLARVRDYLQHMYRNRQIQHDAENDAWSIHLENLEGDILLDMENKYRQALEQLPGDRRLLLARLACIGEVLDIGDASLALDFAPDVLYEKLQGLAEDGWLAADRRDSGFYSFTHKAIYDACRAYLDDGAREDCHKQIVHRLYERYRDDPDAMLQRSTLFTRQILSSSRELYSDELLRDIARYKLTAAEQIMESANMSQAAKTFANGILLLGEDPFESDYSLAYHLHLGKAMCRFALHEFDRATELFEVVLAHAEGDDDRYGAYFKIVSQYLSYADWGQARTYCKRYLAEAGLLLPQEADPVEAGDREYEKFLALTGEDGIAVCLTYQPTEDPLVEHHGNMLAMLADALLFSMNPRCKYYLYKTVNFAVEHGRIFSEFARTFCVGAARYASVRDFSKAKWLIETGLEYAEKNRVGQAFLWCIYGNMVSHWVNPLAETLDIYKQAKYHAVMEGNAFYEAYADMMLLNYHSFIGENLAEYHRETQTTLHNLERSRLTALHANFTTFRQYARCLMGRTVSPDSFDDEQFREESLEEIRNTWNGVFNDVFFYVYRLRALYIHGFYDKGVEYARKYAELTERTNLSAYITHAQHCYYYSMALLELCRQDPDKQGTYLETIHANQEQLRFYAQANPGTFAHKHQLVETGILGLTSDRIELVDAFAEAHRNFVNNGFVWDAAFVERLIADFWEKRNIPQYVVIHKRNALGHYKDIGARYLIRQLADVDEDRGRHHESHSHHTNYTHTTHMTSRTYFGTRGTQTEHTQYSGINVALDFQALLEVLEKLIHMDTLPSLTSTMLTLLLQNGNADKAFLFLEDGSVLNLVSAKYAVDSQSDFNESELPMDIQIVDDGLLPKKLIELAKVKNETLSANSARNEYRLMGDDYLNRHAPESFLCIPVNAKGKHLGVVYLENAALAGSFPLGRIRYLQAVVLQASVLILNLQNVSVMELYTKDLEQRLSSYLGQQNALIAGIAHEINSPVGVCLTVATKLHEKTMGVIDMFTGKALSKSALGKYLEEAKDGLNIINNNVMRAGDLVQNFKQMSVEQSTEVFENLELAPAVRSIVEYVRPGVKKKIDSISIDVPEDLRIYTSSGVLAQIFTNLIMNSAIHGFENREKEGCRCEIRIAELENRDEVEIVYADNGKGMTEDELSKVFQPFYTTKRNRGGSGLGGHIILTLVTQTLGGSVRCMSTPGEGTTFVIRLPKHKQEDATKEVQGND